VNELSDSNVLYYVIKELFRTVLYHFDKPMAQPVFRPAFFFAVEVPEGRLLKAPLTLKEKNIHLRGAIQS
jgi:hypothetical protein